MSASNKLLISWNKTSDELKQLAEDYKINSKKLYDEIASLSDEQLTFENVLYKIAEDDIKGQDIDSICTFPSHVSTDAQLREISRQINQDLSNHQIELSMRKDVYDKIVRFAELHEQELDEESQSFLKKMIKDYRRLGLHLDQETRDKLQKIQKELSDLGIEYSKNISEDKTKLYFTEEELKGLPENLLKTLKKQEDKYEITMSYPHVFGVLQNCQVSNTRKQVEITFNSRCKNENGLILNKQIQLRVQKANLLGFETHADFILDDRMAKTKENVRKFLYELKEKMDPIMEKDLEQLKELKKSHENTEDIYNWDISFYDTLLKQTKYKIDDNKIQEYFPIEQVTQAIFEIYQKLLHLEFKETQEFKHWHDDVKLFEVLENGQIIGYFYTDLYPREGKYSHAACFGLQPGCFDFQLKKRQIPIAALITNFTKPTEEQPSLLQHDEVQTYFHEFGHVMHQICGGQKVQYPCFAGTNVKRDFVEAPSQMLENWVYEPDALKKLSKHYKTNETLPQEDINNLIQAKNVGIGIFTKRQILYGLTDQSIYSIKEGEIIDSGEVYNLLCKDIYGIEASEGTNKTATFGHLSSGYDAQYYGYLWSQVYSTDMFRSRFKKEGILNELTGLDYRKCILEPGGSIDEFQMLRNFLGRDPQIQPFIDSLLE